ncbi:MAG TPA: hypothetical protein VGG99_28080 [Acetobacteraceae bacterium]|jgi:hypothetical protein
MREEYIADKTNALRTTIQRVYATMLIIFEDLGLAHSLAAFQQGYLALADRLVALEHFDGQHELVSNPAIDYLGEQLSLFAPLIEVPSDMRGKRSVLCTILKQTPTLMQNMVMTPAREKDVQDSLEDVLTLAFPDTIREPSIPKQTKDYKPDFGIDSVETAIEVKFIGKESDVGTVLGQLYEDMRGYNSAPGYTLFLGLIYMTGHFVSQERVDAEAAKTDVPKNWHIRVVTGPGVVVPPTVRSGKEAKPKTVKPVKGPKIRNKRS